MSQSNSFIKVSKGVRGAKELRREMRRAGVDMAELKTANREAANVVLPIAEGLAPIRTGALRASMRTGATQKAGIVKAGGKLRPYAGPIHWGWPAKGMPPRPWISVAAVKSEGLWEEAYTEHIQKILKQIKEHY